jgi:hypothetical protein
MLAYGNNALDRLVLDNEIDDAVRQKLITAEEAAAVRNAHKPEVYNPNFFIRVGLFVATIIITSMSFGLLMMFMSPFAESDKAVAVLALLSGGMSYVALEFLIKIKKHYRSGVDDGLIWTSAGYFITAFFLLLDYPGSIVTALFFFVLSACFLVRFAYPLSSLLTFCSLYAFVFFVMLELGTIAKAIMPFVIMIISIVIYLIVTKLKRNSSLRHYQWSLVVAEVLSLISLYTSLNYFVVRELSIMMFDLPSNASNAIAGGWIFWIATALIPALYVARGLKVKDSVMLRVGLVLIVASILTYRFYYNFASFENIMAVGGLTMLLLSYLVTKYLKTPKHGIANEEVNDEQLEGLLQLEGIAIAQTYPQAPVAENAGGFQYGGGSSGGAGATGNW